MSFSPALTAYDTATTLLGPLAPLWLQARVGKGKEDAARLRERFGHGYAHARPNGRLIWLHAASVGESGVALQLIEALSARAPSASFLMTTGTRTSAELVARRAGANTIHAYAPLDTKAATRRFLRYWRPDLGVFVESELWPNLIRATQDAKVPLALVNARMSPATLRRWRQWRAAGEHLMRAFAFVSAADARTSDALSALRSTPAVLLGNLKLTAPAPAIDAAAKHTLATQIGMRPVWLAASTHAGEDEIALAAHAMLRGKHPAALLVLAPRHPERGAAVAALAGGAPRRSLAQDIGAASVYVADTIGELGLFYDTVSVALIAGSLLPHLKGHNPIEPAKLNTAILSGPHVESFEEIFEALRSARAMQTVTDASAIAGAVAALWADDTARARQCAGARGVVETGAQALDQTATALIALLQERTHAPA